MNNEKLIYIADDDENICNLMKSHIENAGYTAQTFSNAELLLNSFKLNPCDMIITDIVMPKISGYDLCREVRKTSMIPIFMVSAHNDEIDRVLGLELGSDDYIAKPISFRELIAKIKNTFRRVDTYEITQNNSPNTINYKDLTLDISSRQVLINAVEMPTTTKEFDLLKLFLHNINRAFSREQIIEKIWGYEYYGDTRQVDHMIKRLRKKMLTINSSCQIQTVWGFGYKIGD